MFEGEAKMDYKLLLDSVVMAGEVMLQSGAETWRVEDTMLRMLKMSRLKTAEVFAMTTGFTVTLDDPGMDSLTVVRRIQNRSMNLERVDRINQLSRNFCSEEISVEELFREVRKIYREPGDSRAHLVGYMILTAGFTLMFGATVTDAVVAAAAGFLSGQGVWACRKIGLHAFLSNGIAAFLIGVTAILWSRFLTGNYDLHSIIIGSIMPLVPGVAITNAIYDTLHGDYISGSARMLEAFVTAAAIGIGVGLSMVLFQGAM